MLSFLFMFFFYALLQCFFNFSHKNKKNGEVSVEFINKKHYYLDFVCSQRMQDIFNTHDEVEDDEGLFLGNPVLRPLHEFT